MLETLGSRSSVHILLAQWTHITAGGPRNVVPWCVKEDRETADASEYKNALLQLPLLFPRFPNVQHINYLPLPQVENSPKPHLVLASVSGDVSHSPFH